MLYQLHSLIQKSKMNLFNKYYSFEILRVIELAQAIELEHKPTLEELLSAVMNREEVEELVKRIVKFIDFINLFFEKKQLNRVVDFLVVAVKNEQQLQYKHIGVVFVIVVLIFVYENGNGQQVLLP